MSTIPHLGPDDVRLAADVLVAPASLAGGGSSRTVSAALDSAAGWTKTIAFGTDAYYTSPCQRVRIANPVESHYGGWTIAFAEDPLGVPDWITTFDRNTPAEVVSAFTTALVEGLGNNFRHQLHGGTHQTGLTPATLFAVHGWQPAPGPSGVHRQLSPDGHCAYRIRTSQVHEYDELMDPELSTWRLSGGVEPVSAPTWQAYFSAGTPFHLISASAEVLANPTPVTRVAHSIPERHLPFVTIQPVEVSQQPARASAALARTSRAGQPTPYITSTTAPVTQTSHAAPPRRQR
ncbi:DUF317 domain-containing protein [Streptomyces sp. G1]|uniref:DUF317 domain-containing protein n=1 Tax=Streptomyces sp. G1 TaxID=361572 RepID=UPI00202FD5D7|nr:DUF317 domain-containing protein [Streptomyces sp. G1]MCM1967981.1 DUF317 domain-containing protein [Streptomyces sp. G1]